MLVIRQQQIEALEEDILLRWIAGYLQEHYRPQAEHLGLEQVAALVRSAVRRARELGLRSSFELRKFVHVTFLLGAHFESDPVCEWTRELLADSELGTIGERVTQLEAQVLERIR